MNVLTIFFFLLRVCVCVAKVEETRKKVTESIKKDIEKEEGTDDEV